MTVRKTSQLRWHKAADRANAREAKAAPLLAWGGLVPQHTATSVRDATERAWAEQEREWANLAVQQERNAAIYRAGVASLVTEGELAALDAYRAKALPKTPEYSADFWHGQAKQRGLFWSSDLLLQESTAEALRVRCAR